MNQWTNLDITREIFKREAVSNYIKSSDVRGLLEDMREYYKKKIAVLEDEIIELKKKEAACRQHVTSV